MASLMARAPTCITPEHMTEYDEPFIGGLSFWHFNMILSGASTAVVWVLMFSLMAEHACHLSNPAEQLKIMRIINMLPSYSAISYAAIIWPSVYVYLSGWVEVFQAIALYAFLMLLIDFLAPTDEERISFFASLRIRKTFKKGKYREGLSWLKLSYYSVLQYPVVVFICAVAQCVLQSLGGYCLDSDSPLFGHIWIEVFSNLSVSFAINAIIRFYQNTKEYIKDQKPLMKLLSFKLMVGLIFLEKIAFMVLEATKVLYPTKSISYADIKIGLPNMIICVQMVLFAIFIRIAFSVKPYKLNHKLTDEDSSTCDSDKLLNGPLGGNRLGRKFQQKSYQGGSFGIYAWLAYLNPFEMLQDGIGMYKLLQEVRIRKQTVDGFPDPVARVDDANIAPHPDEHHDAQPITQYQQTTAYSPLNTQYGHQMEELPAGPNYGQHPVMQQYESTEYGQQNARYDDYTSNADYRHANY